MHDPITQAKVTCDLADGILTLGQIAKKHKVSKTTVHRWAEELKESTGRTHAESKETRFTDAVEEFGLATMKMMTSLAEYVGDPEALKRATANDIATLAGFVFARLEGVIRLQASLAGRSQALPERVEAEIVDA